MKAPAFAVIAVLLGLTTGLSPMTTHAAELKVLAGGGITGPMNVLAPEAAKAFIASLTTPAAIAVIRSKGMEPAAR